MNNELDFSFDLMACVLPLHDLRDLLGVKYNGLVGWLVCALSAVNHKGLYQG